MGSPTTDHEANIKLREIQQLLEKILAELKVANAKKNG